MTIELQQLSENDTMIKVAQAGHSSDEKGIKWAICQTEGWQIF